MNVKELKRLLDNFDDNSEVVFMDHESVEDVQESWDAEDPDKSYCVILDRSGVYYGY